MHCQSWQRNLSTFKLGIRCANREFLFFYKLLTGAYCQIEKKSDSLSVFEGELDQLNKKLCENNKF